LAERFYFAWCDEADPWGPDFQREDEEIFDLEIAEAEGDLPSLEIELRNPRVGLLAAGRNLWCWLAWDDGTTVHPMFHGRLVGVPENLYEEKVRLLFIARPSDYPAQKSAIAASLRELPFYDVIWFDEQDVDDDAVLETRMLNFQGNRLTLEIGVSDMLAGEDGIIEVGPDDHFYSRMEQGFEQTPKRRVHVTATVSWVQAATGEVDLTAQLVAKFRQLGSFFAWPMIGSYTAPGLLDSWPQPETGFGGGWSMALGSSAAAAAFVAPALYAVRYVDKTDMTSVQGFDTPAHVATTLHGLEIGFSGMPRAFFIGWKNFDVVFGLAPIKIDFRVAYEAARKRSEIITFTMASDVQSIVTDPGVDEDETLSLTSSSIDQPVDEDGALPIGDTRRNAYFPTDRGQQSLQFLMLLAAAKLLASARAVRIKFTTTWAFLALLVSCRKSVHLVDPRLPGGEATGKVVEYRLIANGRGGNLCEVAIGCSVGYGVKLGAAAEGEDVYADDWADDYTESIGGQTEVIPGQLLYESLDGTIVVDDDGVDLFNLTPETIVKNLKLTGGPTEQLGAINASLVVRPDDTRVVTTGDVDGTAVTNLSNVEGLVSGVKYNTGGFAIPMLNGFKGEPTTFTFDGSFGGTLSRAAEKPGKGVGLTLTRPGGAVLTPDPIGALRATPTVIHYEFVPVTGGDFQTAIDVTVANLVVPKTIDLEAASHA
jgi:hypothetical protein